MSYHVNPIQMETYTAIHEETNQKYWIRALRDNQRQKVLAEGYEKTDDGLIYYINRDQEFSEAKFKQDIREHGWFSARPYQLAQACDGSIEAPVMALYYSYCRAKGIDPDKIYSLAYPERKEKTPWPSILKKAEWQGVAYPKEWGQKEFGGLLESLTEINFHSLNDALQEFEERELRKREMQESYGKAKQSQKTLDRETAKLEFIEYSNPEYSEYSAVVLDKDRNVISWIISEYDINNDKIKYTAVNNRGKAIFLSTEDLSALKKQLAEYHSLKGKESGREMRKKRKQELIFIRGSKYKNRSISLGR